MLAGCGLLVICIFCVFTLLPQPVQTHAATAAVTADLSQPFDVAITPSGEYAYVTNGGSNSVSVINTATNTVTSTVPVGVAPFAVAIIPDGQYAYVTNGGSASVSVIATATNTVAATINVGIGPYGVAISPDDAYAYVTNFGTSTVSVVSTALNMVVATIPVGNSPQGVTVTPDGLYVYVADFGAGTVSVINTASNTVIKTVTVEAGPNDVAVTPNGDYVYIVNSGSGSVSVIDTATNRVAARTAGLHQPSGVAIAPNSAYAYVSNLGGDTVSVISTATNNIIASIIVGRGPYGLAVTPDGRYIYVANYDSATLSVVNVPPAADVSPSPSAVPIGRSEIEPPVTLTAADQFSLPSVGGCIAFAVNGSCSSAKYEDDAWVFTDLRLNGSELLNCLRISAENSNVTVASISVIQNSTFQTVQLRYTADGQGTQTLNFDLEADGSQSYEWHVVSNNALLPEGQAWSLSPDGAINVTGAYGDVVVQQTAFGDFFGNGEAYSNLPFIEQHSVGIVIGAALVAALAVAVLVKAKTRDRTGEES